MRRDPEVVPRAALPSEPVDLVGSILENARQETPAEVRGYTPCLMESTALIGTILWKP